jgi:hypothetical protein
MQEDFGRLTRSRHLTMVTDSDERGFSAITLLEYLQQIQPLLIVEGMGAPIVQYQQLNASELVDEAAKRSSRRATARFSNRRGTRK